MHVKGLWERGPDVGLIDLNVVPNVAEGMETCSVVETSRDSSLMTAKKLCASEREKKKLGLRVVT